MEHLTCDHEKFADYFFQIFPGQLVVPQATILKKPKVRRGDFCYYANIITYLLRIFLDLLTTPLMKLPIPH